MALQNGRVRPRLVNLGVVGERTASYFTGGMSGASFHLTYSGQESQQSQFEAHVAAEHGAGNTVAAVSVQLGANDFNYIEDPAFQALPHDQQVMQIEQTFASVQTNYLAAVTEVRTLASEADVLIMGYYDPYAVLPAGSPLRDLAAELFQQANALLAGVATATGSRFVDVFPAFVGHELAYTFIGVPPVGDNTHPTALGYGAMGLAMIPGSRAGFVVSLADWRADQVAGLDASLFTGPSAEARAAKRHAMSQQFGAAAHEVGAHANLRASLSLGAVLRETDGRPAPKDWMVPSPEESAVNSEARTLRVLIGVLR